MLLHLGLSRCICSVILPLSGHNSTPILVPASQPPAPGPQAGGCSHCPGTAARLGGCRAFGGCSDFEVRATVRALGAAAARSSSLPQPASVDISVASFQWQHFSGNILCRRLVVPPCCRRVVVLVASSSSPRRRRRRLRRRRRVVASSSPRGAVGNGLGRQHCPLQRGP